MRHYSRLASFFLLLTIISALVGCVHLPPVSSPKFPTPGLPVPGLLGKAEAALTSNPTHSAIQTAANWQAGLCVAGGLACLAFGGLAIYGGQLVPGIKLVIAGVLLPIFGIWWAYHWLMIVIIALVAGAAYWLLLHYALFKPALTKIESWAKTVEARIPAVGTAVVPPTSRPAAKT